MPTISDIIKIAKVSQYLVDNDIANGGLYSKGIDELLPEKIYCIRKNLEKITSISGTTYVNAIGYLTVTNIGQVGDKISVYVNDPELGILLLGEYTTSILDITVDVLAQNIASALFSNTYGYIVTSSTNVVEIEARDGVGEDINGGNNLFIELDTAGDFLITENDSIIDTENNSSLIIES